MRYLLLFVAMISLAGPLSEGKARAEKRIGILLFSPENRYLDAKNGIIDQLKKDGFLEPDVKFLIENANGNKAVAVEAAKKFAAAKLDMVITAGTSATVAVANEIKDVPVIFSMVYDPVETKLISGWKSSGNNLTGASNIVPMSTLLKILKQAFPMKKVGVLYTPGELNSEIQLKEFQATAANLQIKVFPVPLTNMEEVSRLLPEVVKMVDTVFLSGSSVVGKKLPMIVEIAAKARVITVSHLEDHVVGGALLGVTADPHAVGLLAGKKAVEVLKGAKPSSVPIEILDKFDVILNMKTAKSAGIQIPADFMKSVTKVIE